MSGTRLSLRDKIVTELYLPKIKGKPKSPWSALFSLIELLRAYPRQLVISVLVLTVAALASVAQPRIIGYLIDEGIRSKSATAAIKIGAFFCFVEFVRVSAITLQGILIGNLGHDVMHSLRVKLIAHVLRLTTATLNHISTGHIIARVTGDISAIGQLFSVGIISIVEKLLILVGVLIALVSLDYRLALSALILIPIMLSIGLVVSLFAYKFTLNIRSSVAGTTGLLTEVLRNSFISRVLDLATLHSRRFEILNDQLSVNLLRPLYLNAFFHPVVTLLNAGTIALLMYFGSGMVRSGEVSVGVMVSFLTYVLWLFWPIIHIVNQWSVLISGLASVERVTEIFEWEVESDAVDSHSLAEGEASSDFIPEPDPSRVGEIEFRNVWFYYPGSEDVERWALKGLTFKVSPGEHVGIIGQTGCGKSTLLSLLFRLYEPQKGEILLNGIPLRLWPIGALRRYVGLLQQDGALFRGSIQENLSLFSDLSRLASLEGTTFATTDLTRDVTQLSVGERQAVLFARSYLREPKLWVLDEAAAHLDPIMDKALHDLVADGEGRRSLLVVAHRLSTVQELDSLIVMHNGEIVERGTPQQLRYSNGLYAHLLRAQESVESGRL